MSISAFGISVQRRGWEATAVAVLLMAGLFLAVSAISARAATVSATVTVTNVAVTVGDGSIAYGSLGLNTTKSTAAGTWDTQTATNTGNVAEDFSIAGTNSANWTLAGSAGSEQYKHAFCTATCDSPPTNYTALTTSNTSLASNVAANGAQAFDLALTTPTSTTHYTQQSVDVTIVASAH